MYKQSYFGPYLLCIHPKAVDALLEELHKGISGGHTKGDLYRIGLLLKGTSGLACRSLPRSSSKNVISAKDMPKILIGQERSSILFLAYGLLHNEGWI